MTPRPSVLDVAELILQELGPQSPLKLQKLVYYAQAWTLVQLGRPLFDERIEAWVNGPAVSELYQMHWGSSPSVSVGGRAERLSEDEKGLVREMLRYYGHMTAGQLLRLTHREAPWNEARKGLAKNEPSKEQIRHEVMRDYYAHRPWGGGAPLDDTACFSAERANQARDAVAQGRFTTLEPASRALPNRPS